MKNNQINHLFVYGSLRSGFTSPAYQYISKYFTLISTAQTKGLMYDLGDFPVAKSCESENYIQGELYTIIHPQSLDFAMAQLDDYEGVEVELGEIPLYKREKTEVVIDEQVFTAWVYWYNGDVANKSIVLSGDMINYFKNK